MAFPTPSAPVATGFASSVTSMAVSMPTTVSSGDRLLAFVEVRNAGTWSTIPTGWSQLKLQAGGGSVGDLTIFEKIATGSEGGATATWVASAATTAEWQVMRITGAHASTASEVAGTSGDATNANPPSLTPTGGAQNYLWIAVAANAATGDTTGFTAAPTNYTGLQSNGASSGGSTTNVASATRQLNATSEDPGTFTPTSNRFWAAATVAVYPAAGGTVLTKTQSSTARISNNTTKSQTATARIQTNPTKTQSSVARIQQAVTKTQTSIARIQQSLTKTQSSTARLQKTVTNTQSAVGRIQQSLSVTHSAVSRISNSFTKTQSAVSRIANSPTKTQSATARVQRNLTLTQNAVARIQKGLTLTQGAVARIGQTDTKTQSAVSRIQNSLAKTQGATSRIQRSLTLTQSATAKIIQTSVLTKTQSSISRIEVTVTKTQSATATVSPVLRSLTQSAKASILTNIPKKVPIIFLVDGRMAIRLANDLYLPL